MVLRVDNVKCLQHCDVGVVVGWKRNSPAMMSVVRVVGAGEACSCLLLWYAFLTVRDCQPGQTRVNRHNQGIQATFFSPLISLYVSSSFSDLAKLLKFPFHCLTDWFPPYHLQNYPTLSSFTYQGQLFTVNIVFRLTTIWQNTAYWLHHFIVHVILSARKTDKNWNQCT